MNTKIKGFTLIELLVIVGIIGTMSSFVLGTLGDAKDKAKNASIVASMSSLEAAVDIEKYPGSLEALCLDFETGGSLAPARTYIESLGGIWNCDSTVSDYRVFVKLNQDVIASNPFAKTAFAEDTSDPHNFGNYFCINSLGDSRFTHWPGNHLNYPSCDDSTYIPIPVDPEPTPEPTPDPEPETDPDPPAEDDPSFACDNPKKTVVCHHGKSICINNKAKKAHIRHGDSEGMCT